MTKALLAAFVLVGSAFFAGCAEEPSMPTYEPARGDAPSAKKSDDTTTTSGNTNAPTTTTGTPVTPTTTTTTESKDEPVSPAKVVVKPIDPQKPEPPQLPAFECKTDEDSVTASYKIALLRAPDEAGFKYWLLQIQGGQERIEVLRNMVRSEEFTKDRAVLSDEQFVTSLYTGFLARQPDDDGKAFWLGQLQAGVSRTDVAVGFVNSDEFAGPGNNQASCYF